MLHLLPTMLFAATATAQVTTSFWMPAPFLEAEHIGWVGSVVNANKTHTTIVADYDNGTDTSALSLAGGPQTMTIGPTIFGLEVELPPGFNGNFNDTNQVAYNFYCEWPTTDEADSNRTCTIYYPPEVASALLCNQVEFPSTSVTAFTATHTYPARGSDPAGTETVEQSFSYGYGSNYSSKTDNPAFCSGLSSGQQPEEGFSTVYPIPASEIETYYLVLTAGTEKLEATQAASPTMSSAMSTGTGSADATSASSGSAASPTATEAGAPMVTGAPLLVGLGAAVAALLT
jgi:hypothetical protein